MKRNTLYKLLWLDHPRSMFYGGLIGMFIGLSILLVVFQLYSDVNSVLSQDKALLSSDYIVINKQVTALNLSTSFSTAFSPEEVKDLEEQDFVKDMGTFVSNQFKVSALMDPGDDNPSFYTELFFEAVDDRFLDIDTNNWQWNEKNGFIPIIVPRYYLTLYNFGFAESQKLPKISEGLLNSSVFEISIHTPQGKKKYKAGIVALSDRLNSILVPMDFMQFANNTYGDPGPKKVNRIVLETKKIGSGDLLTYLDSKFYQTEKENKTNSKIAALMTFIIGVLSLFGFIIIVLSIMVFILSYQLVLSKSEPTLKSLLSIGIPRKKPTQVHATILSTSTIIITLLSFGVLFLIKYLYSSSLTEYGFELSDGIQPLVYIFALGFGFAVFSLSYLFTKQRIRKLFERL